MPPSYRSEIVRTRRTNIEYGPPSGDRPSRSGYNFIDFPFLYPFRRKTISSVDRSGSQKWRVARSGPVRWRCWAGDYVVFNPLSGQTHLLDIVTGHVLKFIMCESSSVGELRSEISTFLEVEDDDHLATTISEILIRLDEAELIEPMS